MRKPRKWPDARLARFVRGCIADGHCWWPNWKCFATFPGARARRDEGFIAVQRKQEMTCEEFEAIGLDAERDASLSELERAAAREHAGACSRCAALQDSWQAARVELHAFADSTFAEQTPARVEMRLRQEFRTQHGTMKTQRVAVFAAWALAAAAVLASAVSWSNWRKSQQNEAARHLLAPQNPGQVPVQNVGATPS